jgi:hypothetical protein
MNKNYQGAAAALRELDKLVQATDIAIGAMQTRATLAVAEEQAKTNEHLETANLIAYAQLRRDRRQPSLAAEQLVDQRMAVYPEINDELTEDEDDD